MSRRIAGCMTGTSIDAIDAALVEIEGEGLGMSAQFVRGRTRSLGDLAPRLRSLAEQEPLTAGAIAGIARDLALLHTELVQELAAGERVDLVCIHGQTVYHAPPLSWQLFSPAMLVQAIRVPVVFDLRAADLAAGGQGAPITPLADWVLFREAQRLKPNQSRAVVNLGGFVNMTKLPAARATCGDDPATAIARIQGGDVCACNQLLDRLARDLLGQPYDADGQHASRGVVHAESLPSLLDILTRQASGGRSLGTGDEASMWIANWRKAGRTGVTAADLARTACEAIARTIASSVGKAEVLLAGGGVHNRALRASIDAACSGPVRTTDDGGIPASFREAVCFAVLGALAQDRVPLTLPQITGCSSPAPLAGCWMYP